MNKENIAAVVASICAAVILYLSICTITIVPTVMYCAARAD